MDIQILTKENTPLFAREIMKEVKEMIEEERNNKDPYLTATELEKEIGIHTKDWYRKKMEQGCFGRRTGGGWYVAKRKEAEKYIFSESK